MNQKKETLEKEKESLNKSDAVALKGREAQLTKELEAHDKILADKKSFLAAKEAQYRDVTNQIKEEENRKYEKEKEVETLLEDMREEADQMAFQEFAFMSEELCADLENDYKFDLHRQQFEHTRQYINDGEKLLAELKSLDRRKDEMIQKREKQIRELDALQRKISEFENMLIQVENEWKEALYQWNENNVELKLEKELLRELSTFADTYEENSDYAVVRQKAADQWIKKQSKIETQINSILLEQETAKTELDEAKTELSEWENQKEPQPQRSEAVIRNRQRLDEAGIPYQEFYKVIEFGSELDEDACNHLEEALLKMGILDAIVVDEQYREQVLTPVKGCEDHYLFAGKTQAEKSLLDVLELNEEVNDIFSNQRLTKILSSIAYGGENEVSVSEDGSYHMGVLAGTVTGEYEAGYLGSKARERHRLAKIEECKNLILVLEEKIAGLERERNNLSERKDRLKSEYDALPGDTDLREAMKLLLAEEQKYELLRSENEKTGEQLTAFLEEIKEKKKGAIEIAEKLYLNCTYETFQSAKSAAEEYDKNLVELKSAHEMILRSAAYLRERKVHLEDLDLDMDQIRYDIRETESRSVQNRKKEHPFWNSLP